MTTSIRPDLAAADGVELTEFLLARGWTDVSTDLDETVDPPVLVVEATKAGASLDADLSLFVPTASRGSFRASLPDALRTHAGHLRDYEQAIRNGTAVTNAQTTHVIADIIAYLRLTEDRL